MKLYRRLRWIVCPRNGWNAIDKYNSEGQMEGNVSYEKTSKNAREWAGHCNGAYYDGQMDAHIGLKLRLVRAINGDAYGSTAMRKGTWVEVVSRHGGLFTVKNKKGEHSNYVSINDLREVPKEIESDS